MTNDITSIRVFQALDTDQVHFDGRPLNPLAWHFEPADYDGGVFFSIPFATREAARVAALRFVAEFETETEAELEEAAAAQAYYEAESEARAALEAEAIRV